MIYEIPVHGRRTGEFKGTVVWDSEKGKLTGPDTYRVDTIIRKGALGPEPHLPCRLVVPPDALKNFPFIKAVLTITNGTSIYDWSPELAAIPAMEGIPCPPLNFPTHDTYGNPIIDRPVY